MVLMRIDKMKEYNMTIDQVLRISGVVESKDLNWSCVALKVLLSFFLILFLLLVTVTSGGRGVDPSSSASVPVLRKGPGRSPLNSRLRSKFPKDRLSEFEDDDDGWLRLPPSESEVESDSVSPLPSKIGAE